MPRYSVTHARGTLTLTADYDKLVMYAAGDLFTARGIGPPVTIEQGQRLVVEFDGVEGDRNSVVEIRRG